MGDESESDDAAQEEQGAALTDLDLIPDQRLSGAREDRFNHKVIARRVAELVTSTATRSNVALYGSWGSGKSSLSRLVEEQLPEGVGFVYYDAWKYGGHSLRRNFISQAAEQLGLDKEDDRWERFYRGLYVSQRRALFRPPPLRTVLVPVVAQFLVVLALLLFLIAAGAAVIAAVGGTNVCNQVRDALHDLLQPTLGAALILAVFKVVVGTGRVDVEQSKPSDDEEFSERFQELIEIVRAGEDAPWWKRPWRWIFRSKRKARPSHKRLVFFVDELDRCDEKEVVETLIAIRTFLDEEHCVFVVAADRNVLEQALEDESKQATPTDVGNPYYTTAGAFLDKIFAHQLAVPLLRGRRLTRFARDLVRERGGLWADLVKAEGNAQLDPVIYALIPAHVRSPRRVKVLLNNFAANARVAEARGIEWPKRAQEIAKLTALQTEFSGLADDLVDDPRLLKYLLREVEPKSDRAKELVVRHNLQPAVDEAEEGEEGEDAAPYLGVEGESADEDTTRELSRKRDRQRMRKRHREQLKRYLERTAHVRDPQRDLLYLEAAGLAVGLDDPELGELIEDQAPEDPDRVVETIRKRPVEEQNAASRLLADMVQDTIDIEQRNVLGALMDVVSSLNKELSDDAARDANDALKLVSRDRALDPDYLPGALSIALQIGDQEQTDKLVDEPELLEAPDRVLAVACMLDVIPGSIKPELYRRIGECIQLDREVLTTPLRELDEDWAITLLGQQQVIDALGAWLSDPEVDEEVRAALVRDLIDITGGSPDEG